MQKIVLIGGGSGVSELLSALLRKKNVEVAAVISVFDDGKSTGRLRQAFCIPAVGDLRKCFSAASGLDFLEARLPNQHAVGNLILAILVPKLGFQKAVEAYAQLTNPKATILPVSFSAATLIAEFEGGGKLRGESQLDNPPKNFSGKIIKKLQLSPKAKLNPAVKKVLLAADKIVVGPGSLFGSLLPHFAVAGFSKVFTQAKAQKIFIANPQSELGCLGENPEKRAARFGVAFDSILTTAFKTKRWNPKVLVKKILA
jgi:uncharacterized cofD-like protein